MPTRYSHPPENGRSGVLLLDHLEDVAGRVEHVVPATAETPSGESLRNVVETLAYVHDFGKATTFFQQYLEVEGFSGSPPDDRYRFHAPIGAFAAFYALDARGYADETCLAGFVSVAKHHGSLPDVSQYVLDRTHRRDRIPEGQQTTDEKLQTIVGLQIKDINENANQLAETVFTRATADNGSWIDFCHQFLGFELLENLVSLVSTAGTTPVIDRDALTETCYGLVLECWGGLVLADKTSAATRSRSETRTAGTFDPLHPSRERLETYIDGLEAETDAPADPNGSRAQRLNHGRSRARSEVVEQARTFARKDGDVATLTLPTGMGKTLTGLSAALEIRDELEAERIIYALPFTSVIDQVVAELEEIYETDTTGRLLTAHHHLAETTIQTTEDADADEADKLDDIGGMLAESWRAGITVTTFVQLFESLAGPSNRQSMKLPALRNSVIVLDEPQSLPLSWWKLVPRLLEIVTEQYDSTVIAMTATQPQLFDDATELVETSERYFEIAERVRYTLDESAAQYIESQEGAKPYDTAANELLETAAVGESALAICNTIDSARTLTEHTVQAAQGAVNVAPHYTAALEEATSPATIDLEAVGNRVETAGEYALLHLSTRLRPVDRLRLIELAKRLTERGFPLVTISTQLVEAGVDISFDRVYRDLAPLDSIVQAAGRCNRSFERDRGIVTIWWLEQPGEQQKTPAEAVYNRETTLLPVTAQTLEAVRKKHGTLSETVVSQKAVETYYERLHNEKNVGNETYVTDVDTARGDKLALLSLIDYRRAADVVICRTEADRALLDDLSTAWQRYEFDRMQSLIQQTKPLRVSVPIYREDSPAATAIRKLPPVLEDDTGEALYRVDVRNQSAHFDETTGFVIPEDTSTHKFL